MRRFLVPGLFFVLVLAVFLLAGAPARLLGILLPAERLTLQGFEGTLWRGSASRATLVLPRGRLQLGHLQWRLRPLSLLSLRPALALQSRWGGQSFSGDIRVAAGGRIEMRDVDVRLPAQLLQHLAPVEVTGALQLDIAHLLLRDQRPLAGSGRLVWQDAAWDVPGGRLPLGSYALDWQQQRGAPLRGEVLTLAGPVQAGGTVTLEDGAYGVDITLSGDPALDPRLVQGLSLVAQPAAGGLRIDLQGRLPGR